MSFTETFKIFVGNLLCAEDHSEIRLDNESSNHVSEKDPFEESFSLSLVSCCK